MFRPLTRSHRRPPRRGTSFVLIVVVMISFAAAVGVAFALFAGQALRQAQAHKQAAGGGGTPEPRAPEPTGTLNRFLSALVFDVDINDASNEAVTNALRGHSLARSMYGGQAGNTTPWNGVGVFRESMADPGGPPGSAPYAGLGLSGDRSTAVNYTQMAFGPAGTTPFLLDPEYTGRRGTAADGPPGGVYVSKAAGYSYPDAKDFFAAALDPATGEVVTPSFHRDYLFGSLDPTNPNWTSTGGRLLTLRPRPAEHPKFPRVPPNADNNPNPPPGTPAVISYTGDVQNLPGGYHYDANTGRYVARNDSLWMHIGLPTVPFGGRRVQPLVAPLILPLDAVLNAAAHGNNLLPSYTGYGPSEVNPQALLPGAGGQAIAGLHPRPTALPGGPHNPAAPDPRNNIYRYDPYRTALPGYAPSAWSQTAVGAPVTYPAVGSNSTYGGPVYPAAGFDSSDNPFLTPETYNATRVPSNSRIPLSELKRMHLRYALTPDWLEKSFLVNQTRATAPTDLFYNATVGGGQEFTFATGRTTYHGYRTNAAHANRLLLAPQAFALDRPKLSPNYPNRPVANTLGMTLPPATDPRQTSRPGSISAGAFPAPGTAVGAAAQYSDFNGNQWVSAMAALGSVNLNRPLADYRTDPKQPLSVANSGNSYQADADRRKLAHDIFVRLAVATGAALQVTTTPADYPNYQYDTTKLPAPGTPQFNALRYLAQLAVNIVDFRDDDDVSTAFVWNPIPAKTVGRPRNGPPNNVGGAEDVENYADDQIDNRVVFGVERRLSLNEVYSEITNDPSDPPNGKDEGIGDNGPDPLPANRRAHIKFWAELVNPLTAGTPIPLSGYRIEIARGMSPAPAAVAGMPPPADPAPNLPFFTRLYAADNVTGELGTGPDAVCDLDKPTNQNAPRQVGPSGNNYTGNPATGFLLVAPPEPPQGQAQGPAEFRTPPTNPKWADPNVVRSPQLITGNGMGYIRQMPAAVPPNEFNPQSREYRRHVVLLRRKANPYLPDVAGQAVNTNPHVTVDIMDYVPSFDALARTTGMTTSRPERAGNNGGYDPMGERFSVGKVQPYAAYAQLSAAANPQNAVNAVDGPGNYNRYAFPYSMVLAQAAPYDPNDPPNAPSGPRSTFARHNGTANALPAGGTFSPGNPASLAGNETLMTPFDWLIHLDRPLVNALELLTVRDSSPHLVTQRFLTLPNPAAAPGVTYANGYADWYSNHGLGRALELLTVKPFTTHAAHGGRTASPLNVNAVRDQRVVNALFDPQAGNSFNQAFVDTNAWGKWMSSRSGGTTTLTRPDGSSVGGTQPPAQPLHEGGTNDPFLPFGTPAVGAGGFAYVGGTTATPNGIERTILRSVGNAAPQYPGGTAPVLFTTTDSNKPYTAAEALRKIANNVTTVSHTYVVYLTVGYFEIDLETLNPVTNKRDGLLHLSGQPDGPTMTRLGHEAYLNVPGDMRQKFIAMVDTSAMALEPASNALMGETSNALPAFAELAKNPEPILDASGQPVADAATGVMPLTRLTLTAMPVDVNGVQSNFAANAQLVIGYGAEQQVVQVASVPNSVGLGPNEVAVIAPTTVPVPPPPGPQPNPRAALSHTAWGGSVVSNARPGYPGQQPNFDYTVDRFKAVVPYVERVK